ncbi:MAG TPA: BolA family transcriptional regulator [Porticoccaceae bacterium]|nr:BolA family transcriptional regulator [Porticoccaceae bacterium]HCO59239.1 BolA family transcriptional regulator [Porticoccaceae bacterium]
MSVQQQIESKLTAALSPALLQVENESHMHNVPPDAETHFKLIIVSSAFANQRPVSRHQQVYKTLADELRAGVHALAIHAYTPDEWSDKEHSPESPPCHGKA